MVRWWFWLSSSEMAYSWAAWIYRTWPENSAVLILPGRLGGVGVDGWFVHFDFEPAFSFWPVVLPFWLWLCRCGFRLRLLPYGGRAIGWQWYPLKDTAPSPVAPLVVTLP